MGRHWLAQALSLARLLDCDVASQPECEKFRQRGSEELIPRIIVCLSVSQGLVAYLCVMVPPPLQPNEAVVVVAIPYYHTHRSVLAHCTSHPIILWLHFLSIGGRWVESPE